MYTTILFVIQSCGGKPSCRILTILRNFDVYTIALAKTHIHTDSCDDIYLSNIYISIAFKFILGQTRESGYTSFPCRKSPVEWQVCRRVKFKRKKKTATRECHRGFSSRHCSHRRYNLVRQRRVEYRMLRPPIFVLPRRPSYYINCGKCLIKGEEFVGR